MMFLMDEIADSLAIVVIGRNEGQRLHDCLQSLSALGGRIVYVDSGSIDESVEMARGLGAEIVELDPSLPFTASCARNSGLQRALTLWPDCAFVQFVDGDCRVTDGWLERAVAELRQDMTLAVVCGRRRERYPEASVYNRLCDVEWDTPVGLAEACGGDAMFRVTALNEVGSYRDDLIAGEEPELCVRLRLAGWKIRRVDAEMTLHDADMTRFRQWWKRTVRGGHAYAEGSFLHGRGPTRHWVKPTRSSLVWAGLLPLAIIAVAVVTHGWGLILLLIYPFQIFRVSRHPRISHWPTGTRWEYAAFNMLGKFAELKGILQFHVRRLTGRRSRLLEYKSAGVVPSRQTVNARG